MSNRVCDPLAPRQARCPASATPNASACREGYAKAAAVAPQNFDHQCKTTFAIQSARTGLMHHSKRQPYSITSSARGERRWWNGEADMFGNRGR